MLLHLLLVVSGHFHDYDASGSGDFDAMMVEETTAAPKPTTTTTTATTTTRRITTTRRTTTAATTLSSFREFCENFAQNLTTNNGFEIHKSIG